MPFAQCLLESAYNSEFTYFLQHVCIFLLPRWLSEYYQYYLSQELLGPGVKIIQIEGVTGANQYLRTYVNRPEITNYLKEATAEYRVLV